MATPQQWLDRIAALKVDKASGDPAPHKPLLLLVLMDMAERGELRQKELPLTPELAFRFCALWKIVAHRRKQGPDVRFPFHCLRSDGFWSALDEDGKPSPHRKLTRLAVLPSDLLAVLNDPAWRDTARRLLIARYFTDPGECIALSELAGIPTPSVEEKKQAVTYQSAEEAQKQGREVRFRLRVVAAYDYTCALTGYRLTTISGGCIVDAAHIHQFSDSRNNDPRNGMALCKNAHWLFDKGLWTLSQDYRVLVATDRFAEDSPDQKALRQYHGEKIRLPGDANLWPNPIHLTWHQKNRFKGL